MKPITLAALAAFAALSTAAFAGTIHGKVSGVKGESVVYVEAVAGKTFPAPSQHVTMDQKGLMFVPHTTSSGLPSAATRSWATTWAPGLRVSVSRSNSTPPASFRCSATCIQT